MKNHPTPGPWKCEIGPNKNQLHFIRAVKDSQKVAVISSWDDETSRQYAERVANARLIASAPDLLENLGNLIKWVDQLTECNYGKYPMLGLAMGEARAAILKATQP